MVVSDEVIYTVPLPKICSSPGSPVSYNIKLVWYVLLNIETKPITSASVRQLMKKFNLPVLSPQQISHAIKKLVQAGYYRRKRIDARIYGYYPTYRAIFLQNRYKDGGNR